METCIQLCSASRLSLFLDKRPTKFFWQLCMQVPPEDWSPGCVDLQCARCLKPRAHWQLADVEHNHCLEHLMY